VVTSLGLPSITSNVLGCSSVPCYSQYGYDLPDNQRVGIRFNTVPTSGDNVAVWSRSTTTGSLQSGVACYFVQGTGIQLYWQVGGGSSGTLGTYTTTTPAVGDWLEIESIGTVHTCYLNGLPILSGNDTNVAHGYAMISFGHGTSGKFSAFVAKGMP
jgi:hypothetical protein